MKKLTIFYCLLTIALLGAVYVAMAGPVIEPKPIEIKPVLISEAEQWDLTKAYYQKVKMPDGSRMELKSTKPLTKEQWQKKADDVQKAIENEPKPSICPHCGQEWFP